MTVPLIVGLFASALALLGLSFLTVLLWPPSPWSGAVLVLLAVALLVNLLAQLRVLRRQRERWRRRSEGPEDLPPEAVLELRLEGLEQAERRLEFRELRLARRMRTQQLSEDDEYIDLLQDHPDDEELSALVDADRRLMALVEAESQRAFDRVLANRYAGEDGVDTDLVLEDVRSFIEQVARLYRPETEDPLLETDIELLAKSSSSAALHLLVVIEDLPLDFKSYNLAKVYRLIRRGASYYGTYKALRPYLETGLNALQVARLALGMNPASAGAAWVAGRFTSHGAKALGEHLLQQQALRLLHDFIRVLAFEAAMIYGGQFRHRDANWIYGAQLVNLEVARGQDLSGRDIAYGDLCKLALRHEFDRIRLIRQLANGKPLAMGGTRPEVIMTREERESVAKRLAVHCRTTGVDLDEPEVGRWREGAEAELAVPLGLDPGYVPKKRLERVRGVLRRLPRPRRRKQRRATSAADEGEGSSGDS